MTPQLPAAAAAAGTAAAPAAAHSTAAAAAPKVAGTAAAADSPQRVHLLLLLVRQLPELPGEQLLPEQQQSPAVPHSTAALQQLTAAAADGQDHLCHLW
jgi:hypothetical protein